jgi:hypothetical protein
MQGEAGRGGVEAVDDVHVHEIFVSDLSGRGVVFYAVQRPCNNTGSQTNKYYSNLTFHLVT